MLRYEHVEISYNGSAAVRDVNFSLHAGEILGIVGESGSGKSTILKAAMGLLGSGGLVTCGDIWFRGKNISDFSAEEMRKINGSEISMIFQNSGSSFCPVRTIGDQLWEAAAEHGAKLRREFEQKATETLTKLRLGDVKRILSSYPFELSGGMQQRVGIAAAILPKPSVLLADEPTSALDVSAQKQAVEELLLIRALYNTAIVIVTHNIGVARAMADSVLVMKNGRVVEYGADILENPHEDYTKKLIAAVPKISWRRSLA